MITNYYEEMLKMFTHNLEHLDRKSDPYLHLRGPFSGYVTRKLLHDCLKIKKRTEWELFGYKFKIDQLRYDYEKIDVGGWIYSFNKNLNLKDERVIEAINTGKKLYWSIDDIIEYLTMGYSLEDFITLPEDLIYYSEAGLFYHKFELEQALSMIEKAISLNQYDKFYEFYFKILLELKKSEMFNDYIKYYQNNYRTIIHNETLFKWLRLLLKEKKMQDVLNTIDFIRNEIIQKPESKFVWENTIEKFEKNIAKINKRLYKRS